MSEETRSRLQTIAYSPELFLRDIDPVRDIAVLSPMSEATYRASSFLDNRIERDGDRDLGMPLGTLERLIGAQRPPRRTIHWLFHVGHCGSSLLSRLLGEVDGLLALREPAVVMGLSRSLRQLGQPDFPVDAERWAALRDLSFTMLGRSFRPTENVLVKPTSHAANLIPEALGFTTEARAVLLHLNLETYLATMLRPETQRELGLYARDFRLRDFLRHAPDQPDSTAAYSPGQLAAFTWLLHAREFALALDDAELGSRCLSLSFDDYLAAPGQWLGALCAFLGRPQRDATVAALLAGPAAAAYAKDPTHGYDASRREQELERMRETRRDEIAAAVAWSRDIAARTPAFAGLIERFSRPKAPPGTD